VTRDRAIARLSKLREITVERGATQHEAAAARALAAQLSARFGLERDVAIRPQVVCYAKSATTDRRSPQSLRLVALV